MITPIYGTFLLLTKIDSLVRPRLAIITVLQYCIIVIFAYLTLWDRTHMICLYASVPEYKEIFPKTRNASNKKA